MVRTQIQITEQQSRVLKQLAIERGVSVAELIRQSIDLLVSTTGTLTDQEIRQKALSIVGKYGDGEPDLSVDHDRYLAEIYG